MAVKYAVANGNWSAGATWNGGVVPVDGDEVYCNGYTITANVDINLPNSILTNEECPITGNSGGYINVNVNGRVVTFKEIYAYLSYIIGVNNAITCTINADIYAPSVNQYGTRTNCAIYLMTGGRKEVVINGNCYGREAYSFISTSATQQIVTTINGNVLLKYHLWILINFANAHLINGNLSVELPYELFTGTALGTMSLSIIGNITGKGYISNINGAFTIGGSYYYSGFFGLDMRKDIQFLNQNAEIKYVGVEPNPNYYVVLAQQQLLNHQQYPAEDEVKEGTEYAWGEKVGTYTPDYPPESVVLKDFEYGDSDDRKTGTMTQEVNVEVGCVTPEDVRKDVPLVGMGIVGSLVVPSVDDVREGVIFDNGSVGTLIVQGGGERLRIADFGYYTNAQSDTYIVDLTEQDKPKFAVAEERVLIEMFPDLDLNNIPDKYFDDLFVKYLKYRLIVEYYRTAGINSTFTPSEPTTEIVNYQNVRNEVWLNSANIYLKAWSKKYPESITRPQRILL